MKNVRFLFIVLGMIVMLSSCKAWNSMFGPKYGCGTNGKNVGAEKNWQQVILQRKRQPEKRKNSEVKKQVQRFFYNPGLYLNNIN